MPAQTYQITAPNGKSLEVTGDHMPTEAELHDIFAQAGVDTGAQSPDSALSRFGSGLAKNLNPITAIEGLAGAVRHPLDTASSILQANLEQLKKAGADYQQGRYSEMVGHGVAGVLPIIGPSAAAAGERIGSGDVAGGLGEATGLLAPFGVGPAVQGASAAVRGAAGAARALPGGSEALDAVANLADRASVNRMVDVAAPKVGPNKLRLNNQIAKVAPQLAREADLSALSRQGLQAKVGAKLADATAALDEASDSRLNARTFPTQPIIDDLLQKRAALTSQAVEGSLPTPAMDEGGRPVAQPLGRDTVPAPNRARVAQIDQAISEVKQLGPVARYEPLRRIREAYDQPAKATYSPAVTADYLAKRGESLGAADVTSALRDNLAQMDPVTAKANADYSLYKTANDVLRAAEETERARPRVLRGIVARTGGAMVGAESGGVIGAGAGVLLGATVERAAELAPTMKIVVARKLANVADLLRAGKAAEAQTALKIISRGLPKASAVARETAVPLGQLPASFPMAADNQPSPPPTRVQR